MAFRVTQESLFLSTGETMFSPEMQLYQRLAVLEMSLYSCLTHYIDGDFIAKGPGHET